MSSVRSSELLNCPAASAWAVIRDSSRLSDWFTGIVWCTVEGSRRTILMANGRKIVEDIVTLDDDLRRFQYSIAEGVPGVTRHLGTVDVIPLDEKRCLVIYGTDVEPSALGQRMQDATGQALARLRDHFA